MDSYRHCYKIKLAYDGANFHGFQIQPDVRTVQGEVERVLSQFMGHTVRVVASGRTDKGVHAFSQFVSFQSDVFRPDVLMAKVLSDLLPKDISVQGVQIVPSNFHAQYSALNRTYRYHITSSETGFPRALLHSRMWVIETLQLNWVSMEVFMEACKGKHDFLSFAYKPDDPQDSVREIEVFTSWLQEQDMFVGTSLPVLVIECQANGFLRRMVRMLVGTLISLGLGKIHLDDALSLLLEPRQGLAGPAAPAEGLYLWDVNYF